MTSTVGALNQKNRFRSSAAATKATKSQRLGGGATRTHFGSSTKNGTTNGSFSRRILKSHAADTVATHCFFRQTQRENYLKEAKPEKGVIDIEKVLDEHDREFEIARCNSSNGENLPDLSDVVSRAAQSMVSATSSLVFSARLRRIIKSAFENKSNDNKVFFQNIFTYITYLSSMCSSLNLDESAESYFMVWLRSINESIQESPESYVESSKLSEHLYVGKLLVRRLDASFIYQNSPRFLPIVVELLSYIDCHQSPNEHKQLMFLICFLLKSSGFDKVFDSMPPKELRKVFDAILQIAYDGDFLLAQSLILNASNVTRADGQETHNTGSKYLRELGHFLAEVITAADLKLSKVITTALLICDIIHNFDLEHLKHLSEAIISLIALKSSDVNKCIIKFFTLIYRFGQERFGARALPIFTDLSEHLAGFLLNDLARNITSPMIVFECLTSMIDYHTNHSNDLAIYICMRLITFPNISVDFTQELQVLISNKSSAIINNAFARTIDNLTSMGSSNLNVPKSEHFFKSISELKTLMSDPEMIKQMPQVKIEFYLLIVCFLVLQNDENITEDGLYLTDICVNTFKVIHEKKLFSKSVSVEFLKSIMLVTHNPENLWQRLGLLEANSIEGTKSSGECHNVINHTNIWTLSHFSDIVLHSKVNECNIMDALLYLLRLTKEEYVSCESLDESDQKNFTNYANLIWAIIRKLFSTKSVSSLESTIEAEIFDFIGLLIYEPIPALVDILAIIRKNMLFSGNGAIGIDECDLSSSFGLPFLTEVLCLILEKFMKPFEEQFKIYSANSSSSYLFSLCETLKFIVQKLFESPNVELQTRVTSHISEMMEQTINALKAKDSDTSYTLCHMIDHLIRGYASQDLTKVKTLFDGMLASKCHKIHKILFNIYSNLIVNIDFESQDERFASNISDQLQNLCGSASPKSKPSQMRCLQAISVYLVEKIGHSAIIEWIKPFLADIIISFVGISSKATVYCKALFKLLYKCSIIIEQDISGFFLQFFSTLLDLLIENDSQDIKIQSAHRKSNLKNAVLNIIVYLMSPECNDFDLGHKADIDFEFLMPLVARSEILVQITTANDLKLLTQIISRTVAGKADLISHALQTILANVGQKQCQDCRILYRWLDHSCRYMSNDDIWQLVGKPGGAETVSFIEEYLRNRKVPKSARSLAEADDVKSQNQAALSQYHTSVQFSVASSRKTRRSLTSNAALTAETKTTQKSRQVPAIGKDYKRRDDQKGDIKGKNQDLEPYAYVGVNSREALTRKGKIRPGLFDELFNRK